MNKIDKKEIFTFFSVILFTIIGIFIFWGTQGHIEVDTGREFYIPEQMLKGQALYKDIFNIYGALAYQINALLYNFWGVNTLTLHIAGNIVGLGIIALIYLVSRQILDRFYSVVISVVAIVIGIFKMGIFNYTVPYSFAVTYGLLSALIALYFISLFLKKEDKKYLYLSVFFAGTAFALKYDFAPFLLIYPIICYLQKENIKTFFKLVLIGLIVPFVSFLIVFLSGVNFNDFLNNVELFRKIAQAPSLTTFYLTTGVYVTFKNFFFNPLSWYIGVVTLILFLIKYKQIQKNKYHLIVLLSYFLLSLKALFICNLGRYGIYSFPFLLMALFLILSKYYFKNFKYLKLIIVIVCIIAFYVPLKNQINDRLLYLSKTVTSKGWISSASNKTSSKLLIDIILKNTNTADKIVILPEGHMINFLTGRLSDNYYGNLIPMYVETFGEKEIIEHYNQNKPEYFILTDRDTKEYGRQYICTDYAQNLCTWILENYHVVYRIDGEPQYLMLRKNQ